MTRFTILLAATACLAQTDSKPATAAKPAGEALNVQTDLGYRFITGEHGSTNAYRSVINLGEGPRVLGFQASAPGFRLMGSNWGDPFNTLMGQAEKKNLFRLSFQYRNLAYFDALPSFANTQFGRNAGIGHRLQRGIVAIGIHDGDDEGTLPVAFEIVGGGTAHFQDNVGILGGTRRDAGAGRRIFGVRNTRLNPGAGLNRDRGAKPDQLLHRFRGAGDPWLGLVGFLSNRDFHDAPRP